MAESVKGLYKSELIRRRGQLRHAEHVELELWPEPTGTTTSGSTGNLATSPAVFEHAERARTQCHQQASTATLA